MRRVAGDQRQRQPRALAARQLADLGRRLVARKAEPAELRAHRAGAARPSSARVMCWSGVSSRVELLDLILREIADAHLARRVHRAVHRRELGGEQARERGLAVAVAPEQRDAVVGIEPQVEPAEDRRFAIADAGQVERDQRRAQFGGARGSRSCSDGSSTSSAIGCIRASALARDLRLLGGRGAGGIARDIFLQLLALGLLLLPRRGDLRLALGALALERVIAAGIERTTCRARGGGCGRRRC